MPAARPAPAIRLATVCALLLGAAVLAPAVFLTAACAGSTPATTASEHPSADDRQFSDHQVMVTYPATPPPILAQIVNSIEENYRLTALATWTITSIGEPCTVFQMSRGRPVEELVARLSKHPQVSLAQPIYEYETLQGYNDPYAHLQYGTQALRLEQAHRLATGKGVRVAVVDTGVDVDHPDLRGRISKVGNFVDRGERTFTSDIHGTAVAGVIAARANNEVGIVGVAPGAEVLALKACWEQPPGARRGVCNSYTLARAVDFAIGAKAQVLNFSLAGPSDPLLGRLIAKAVERGITVVAAHADTQGRAFPASLDGVLGVFATDPDGGLRSALPLRTRPAFAAPGVDVLSTAPRSSYDFFSGSSLAAAHVTGVVALLLERNPGLKPAAIEQLIRATSRPINGSDGVATAIRMVDACAALAQVAGAACP